MANKNRIVVGVLALSFCGTLSSAQAAATSAIDPATIAGAYAENPVNADLLYKGKDLTVEGVITAISSNSAGRGARERGEVGSAAFASLSDVKKRFGGRAALEGVVSARNVTIWHCSFDASRVEELAQLRRNDVVILEGQLESYPSFRHCRVVTKEVAPPEEVPPQKEAVHDSSTGGKDCQVETKGAPLPEEFHMGGGVSPPKAVFAPDPEYAEEARKAKLQGKCVLRLVVGTDGCAHDVRVSHTLGLGLDEKAIEAVKTWKFEPAMQDGKPVAVQINVEVTFRLYEGERRCTGYDKHLRQTTVPCPPGR
jgi:TonB family protein